MKSLNSNTMSVIATQWSNIDKWNTQKQQKSINLHLINKHMKKSLFRHYQFTFTWTRKSLHLCRASLHFDCVFTFTPRSPCCTIGNSFFQALQRHLYISVYFHCGIKNPCTSLCSSALTYARATSLNVLPSRINMKQDWPGLELITDTSTTPVSGEGCDVNRKHNIKKKKSKESYLE